MTSVLQERKEKTQKGRRPCANRGRDWNDRAISQEPQEPPETEEARKESPLKPSEAAQPC